MKERPFSHIYKFRVFAYLVFILFLTTIQTGCSDSDSSRQATSYTVSKLIQLQPPTSSAEVLPWVPFHAINNKGELAWEGYDGAALKIYKLSNGEVSWVSEGKPAGIPALNDRGEIVWLAVKEGMIVAYFYSEGVVSQIENLGPRSFHRTINDLGDVVLSSGGELKSKILLNIYWSRAGTAAVPLTQGGMNIFPDINDEGQIVWEGTDDEGIQIFLGSGVSTKRITENSTEYYSKRAGLYRKMNKSGQVVWTSTEEGTHHIYLYTDGMTHRITKEGDNRLPQINDRGQVVWLSFEKEGKGIYLYDDGVATRISEAKYNDFPYLNNLGQVVWQAREGKYYSVFLYDKGKITRISEQGTDSVFPKINDLGQIAWVTREWKVGGNGYIYKYLCAATPPGAPIPPPTSGPSFTQKTSPAPSGKKSTPTISETNSSTLYQYYPEKTSFKFAYFADSRGHDKDYEEADVKDDRSEMCNGGFLSWFADYAKSESVDFVIFAGDMNNLASHNYKWKGFMKDLLFSSIPLYFCIGNHELYDGTPDCAYWKYQNDYTTGGFAFNVAYPQNSPSEYENLAYAFTWGNALFVIIDTHWLIGDCCPVEGNENSFCSPWSQGYDPWNYMGNWLEKNIMTQDAYKNARHKFVIGHAPVFGVNQDFGNLQQTMVDLWNVFDKHGFDVYLTGHQHYVSWKAVESSDCSYYPQNKNGKCQCTNPDSQELEDCNWSNKVYQLISGAGGVPPDPESNILNDPSNFKDIWNVSATRTIVMVSIDDGKVSLDVRAVNSTGEDSKHWGTYSDGGSMAGSPIIINN